MSIPLKDLAAVPPRSSRSPAIDKLPTDDPPTSPISPSSTSSSQFTSGPTINLEVCVVDAGGVRPKTLRSCKEAQDYFHDQPKLTTSSNDDGGITDPLSSAAYIICLYQAYRWGPLTISEEVANLVTAHVETFPEFSNLTNKFRKAQGPRDEGWCEFHSSFTPIQSQLPGEVNYVIESCYLLNHVEWNGRPGAVDPWTIHQSGVYQKYLTFEQSACILIEPSINMQNRLRKTLKEGQAQTGAFISHWTELHILSIEDLDDNWQAYVNFLHDSIMEIYRQIRFFRLGGTPGGEGDRLSDVTFEQMRRLQYFSEKLLRAAHILQNNVEVLTALLGQSKTMCALDKAASKSRYEALDTVLDRRIRAQGFCKNYVQSLSKRSDRISVEFRDVIALRDNERMRDLTRLTFESNERMQSLTQQTVKETKAMKALTLIALIYLPATFTATFLSMGYIHTTSVKGGLRLTVRKEMWIYLAITLPLLCVTFIFWFAWYYRNRKHEEETTLEAGKQKGGV